MNIKYKRFKKFLISFVFIFILLSSTANKCISLSTTNYICNLSEDFYNYIEIN